MPEQDLSAEGVKRKEEGREEMVVGGAYAVVQRYSVTLEHIGTGFLGFQRQKEIC